MFGRQAQHAEHLDGFRFENRSQQSSDLTWGADLLALIKNRHVLPDAISHVEFS